MKPSELLSPSDVLLDFDAADKWQAIQALVDHLVETGRLVADFRDPVLEAVLEREKSMSTGMEHGVAIPHAAVEEVSEIVACMAVIQRDEGLDFESIDGQATRVVVLLVIPKGQKLLHIRTLADIARVLTKDRVRSKLVESKENQEAHAILVAGEA